MFLTFLTSNQINNDLKLKKKEADISTGIFQHQKQKQKLKLLLRLNRKSPESGMEKAHLYIYSPIHAADKASLSTHENQPLGICAQDQRNRMHRAISKNQNKQEQEQTIVHMPKFA